MSVDKANKPTAAEALNSMQKRFDAMAAAMAEHVAEKVRAEFIGPDSARTHFSSEEVRALPEWEGFGGEIRMIDGERMRVPVMGRQLVAFYVDDTTPLIWQESDGTYWRLGRYADGQWCKLRD